MKDLTILGTEVPQSKEVREYLVTNTVKAIHENGYEIEAAICIKQLSDMLDEVKVRLWNDIKNREADKTNKVDGYTVTAKTRDVYDWSQVTTPQLDALTATETAAKDVYDAAKEAASDKRKAIIAATATGGYSEAVKNDAGEVIDIIEVSNVPLKSQTKYLSVVGPKK